jgi:hypothetical protein
MGRGFKYTPVMAPSSDFQYSPFTAANTGTGRKEIIRERQDRWKVETLAVCMYICCRRRGRGFDSFEPIPTKMP